MAVKSEQSRNGKKVECEECGHKFWVYTIDSDGTLIGDECPNCGYYVTRYMPGRRPQ